MQEPCASFWFYLPKVEIRNQTPSIESYLLKNNPTKFHPDPIWDERGFVFFEDGRPNKKNKMSTNTRPVIDLVTHDILTRCGRETGRTDVCW